MTSATSETVFYRWIIVLCSFLILFVSNGMTIAGITVFDLEVLATLGEQAGREITLGELKARDRLMFLTAGLLGMAAGWLADKVGVKPLIIVGLALLARCRIVSRDPHREHRKRASHQACLSRAPSYLERRDQRASLRSQRATPLRRPDPHARCPSAYKHLHARSP